MRRCTPNGRNHLISKKCVISRISLERSWCLARCSINSPQDELEARGEPLTLNFEKGSRPVHGAGPLVVLVVEDEWLISAMIATHLREAGYLALEFATGDAAVSLLRQGGHFDILLTDINLGTGANG
jgi:PleD family two-component response regulator